MITITKADLVLIQDAGRHGFETSGVPRSGAWDLEQYHRVAALLGQSNPAVFEILAGTFSFSTDDTIDLAVTGFGSPTVAQIDQSVTVAPGTFTMTVSTTSYVGVGGLVASQILGSASTDTVSGLGPKRVMVGDSYEVSPGTGIHRIARQPIARRTTLRFIPGPHLELGEVKTAVATSSRSGIRLASKIDSGSLTLASLPIVPGAIQSTSSELIIVGPDGGVTGGYPVVGVVCAADLPVLARLRDGDEISLKPVTLQEIPELTSSPVVDISML